MTRSVMTGLALAALLAAPAAGQAPATTPRTEGGRSPATVVPEVVFPSAERQVSGAVLPLPEAMRAGATVLGWRGHGPMVQLRKGTNGMICLADDPSDARFHAACYQEAMDPFMARGRALRMQGVTGDQVDSVRFREVREGKLVMPKTPAALWSLTAEEGAWSPTTGEVTKGRALYVIYIPFATEASTGIPATPARGTPWLMHPGTPKAHVMFVPTM